MTSASSEESWDSWVYKAHTWDPPELQQFLSNTSVTKVASDKLEVNSLCLDVDGQQEQKSCLITFDLTGFNIGERHINNSEIRCITTKTWELPGLVFTLLLSFRQEHGVESFFIHPPGPAMAVRILNTFRKLQSKFESHELTETSIYDFFVPMVVCRCDVDVADLITGRITAKTYIVCLDEECMCLYSQQYQTRPDFQVNFVKEAGDHVVEKMAVVHSINKFTIETRLNRYSMDVSKEEVKTLVQAMKTIKPKPKNCYRDLKGTMEYLLKERGFQTPRSMAHTSVGIDSYFGDTDHAISESARQFYRGFKDDLETAYREGETNPDWLMLWTPHDEGLREVLKLNLVPQRDARSGGLNPDDIGHFQTSLSMIDDQLFNQEFEGAVSSLRSMREVFSESKYQEVRKILDDDDYMLLRKLFYYFLKKQAT